MLGFIFFDPMWFVFVGPAMLVAMWAQYRIKSAYAKGSQIAARSGLTGAQTAQRILEIYEIEHVRIERIQAALGDHYDPRKKVLRLSPDVYDGRSLASLGIAAHEVGHAIQDARNYGPLVLRQGIVPLASFGTNFAFILILAGLFIQAFQVLALVGLGLYFVIFLAQLINLPVEFNASSRARAILVDHGMVSPQEDRDVKRVLDAAAMTYVAAMLTSLATLLYFAFRVLGSRD